MYIHIHVNIYVYIYIRTHIHIYIYVYIYVCIYIFIYIYMHIYLYTGTRTKRIPVCCQFVKYTTTTRSTATRPLSWELASGYFFSRVFLQCTTLLLPELVWGILNINMSARFRFFFSPSNDMTIASVSVAC